MGNEPLTSERIPPETIASFLEGTLPPAERERVMRVLARGGEDYEDFLDAVALQVELEEAPGQRSTPVDASRRPVAAGSRRRWVIAPMLVAAGLVAVVLISRRLSEPPYAGGALARGLGSDGQGAIVALGPDWREPGWPVSRGVGDGLSPRARSFRAGARYAELEIASGARDASSVSAIAAQLATLASGAESGGGAAAARIEQIVRSGSQWTGAERDEIGATLRALSVPEWFDLGIWSETARLASQARVAAFFAPGGAARRELLRIIRSFERLGGDEQQAAEPMLARLRRFATGETGVDPDVLRAALDSTVADGGR
jgi:hypothetical protein